MGLISDQDMWDAVIQCNEKYDGIFIYAVKSTGICCKPSCKSRAPLRDNISFYSTITLAMEDGFRPCKRCRPDLYQSNEEEIIYSSKQYIEKQYRNSFTLDQLAQHVGVSKYHLQRLFKRMTGLSPLEYATQLKISDAIERLLHTEDTITEIAFHLGFKSSSHFSNLFRQHTDYSPTEYRKEGISCHLKN